MESFILIYLNEKQILVHSNVLSLLQLIQNLKNKTKIINFLEYEDLKNPENEV